MECSLGQALQGALAILTRVRPKDLGGQRRARRRASVRSPITSLARPAGGQPPSPGMVASPMRITRPGISWPRMRRASGSLAAGLLSQARPAITGAYRGPDGQALLGSAREAPGGWDRPADSPPSWASW